MSALLIAEFVLLAALWGSSFMFMLMGATEFGPWATAGLRVAVASAVLLPWLVLRGHWPVLRQHARALMLVGLANAGLPFALYAFALLHISTGVSAILNATTPLFGALVAWVWLKDVPHSGRAVGLAVGFAGVVMLSWPKADFSSGGTGWAVLACLGATLSYGIAASATKRFLMGIPPLVTATGSLIGASLGLAVPAAWFWPAQTPSLMAWGAIAVLGVLCTALAYILYFRLIEQAGPSKTLTVTFLIPVFAMVYGAGLLGETVTGQMVWGGAVILLGVALATGWLRWPMGRDPDGPQSSP
jgi:drug/metabolite transporter (DMT)-like permease